ncbi:MAG TPA: ABC-F family ATP-binding cassette domain-containing protein [Methylomirabilota bacterium]|nr:ABC-F family ATP-binding cassette domain-containing protein [Methylomirabilota bacterium]
MLTLSDISKAYGGRTLFDEATLQVNREDRIGLVGPNGAGKTTLFSIILGNGSADSGKVIKERNVVFGYLPQESAPVGDETVMELATAISPEFVKLRRLILAWDSDHHVEPSHAEEIHDDAHNRFHELGGYQLDAKAKQILSGLGFREKDFDRPARELSGGWVMRAHLARLLVQEPDLLLLDEPTNHLDLEALLWFQEYLTTYPGAIIVISHDREFLNHIVSGIVEIRSSKLNRYRGNYDEFLVQRAAAEEQLLAAYKNQQKEIERLQLFADRFRAKASKASQAQSKLKQIERMDKIEAPTNDESKIGFRFPQPLRSGHKVITLENIHQAYGENVVYRGMEFKAERGQRTVLVGPNGAGKSTLLKILAGVLVPQSGVRTLGHNVKAGYYSQYRVDMLQASRTVFEEAMDTPSRITEQFVRTLLGSFLFRGDDVFKKVSVLSGGEKSRLALVKLLLDPPNLLLMDEPTTHLDMASIDALVYALGQFEGTLVFISHDVYFIRALANHVVHVNAGQLTHYPGGYQYYLDKTKASSARAALTSGGTNGTASPQIKNSATTIKIDRKEQKRIEAQQRQARSGEKKAQQQLVHKLEKEIQELEAKQVELTAELEKPETYEKPGRAQEINRELAHVQERLATATPEWEAAEIKLAATP